MPEPDNHTLRLLREIRSQGEDTRKDLDDLRNGFNGLRRDVTQGFEHISERLEHLTRLVTGESVLGRYAAANVDERLDALEKRVTALEERR
jgi:polyhydroxyalkanoate synthesis regulator phasin